jgi:invasion protein IalB
MCGSDKGSLFAVGKARPVLKRACVSTLAVFVPLLTGLATAQQLPHLEFAQSTGKASPKKEGEKPAAVAAGQSATTPAADSWAVKCSNQAGGVFACEMVQAIVDSRSGVVVMLISIGKPHQPGLPAILFRTVHGTYLPAGLSFSIEGKKATRLDFQKSDAAGVYAALPLTAEIVADLKKATEIVLESELNKDQKLTLKAPLMGFGPAYDRVVSAQ